MVGDTPRACKRGRWPEATVAIGVAGEDTRHGPHMHGERTHRRPAMQTAFDWTPQDLEVLQGHGISRAEAERQLRLFTRPARPLQLDRPCTIGDGIRRLEPAEHTACLEAYETAREAGRWLKFVPASGAASRMFATLLEALHSGASLRREDLAQRPDDTAAHVLRFFAALERFAFYDSLQRSIAARGQDLPALVAAGDFRPVLVHLLTDRGLDFASLPKALLPFHRHPQGARTALEEQLIEAAHSIPDRTGRCRMHFTVASEAQARFTALVATVVPALERRLGVHFDIGFSSQKPSTDTIAVDADNRPFRSANGELLLRPGGHGALIENLSDLGADLVTIKNIDNVATEEQLDEIVRWKKLLGGALCLLEQRLSAHAARLGTGAVGGRALDAALRFARDELLLSIPETIAAAPPQQQQQWLLRRLQRPLRVCGMVRNTGEPGGGPFWVRGSDGETTVQIVERAEIDPNSPDQQRIFATMTHFSPVDLVCSLRDASNRPFALRDHVDLGAVFISDKTSGGRKLRALEHPGLWNGGMSDWNTLLVEVPGSTFNPVKTITDLLRPAHQPR